MHARLQTCPCALPRTVPEACPPSGITKPSAWRFFLPSAAYQDILERSPRGEGQHGSETSPLPDGGPGQTLLKVRHGIRLPCRSIPKPEHHGRMSDKMASRPLRPATATKRAGCRVAPVFPPGVVRVPAPPTSHSLPASPKRPSSAWIASRPAACHASSLIKAYARRIRLFIAERPIPILSRGIPAARKQTRERKAPPLSTPQHPPFLLSGRMACLISNSRQTTTGTFAPT